MKGEFVRFAFTNKGRGARSGHFLQPIPHDFGACRCCQLGKFLQRIPCIPPVSLLEFDAYEKYSFCPPVACLDQCFQFALSVPCSLSVKLFEGRLPHLVLDKKWFLQGGLHKNDFQQAGGRPNVTTNPNR